MQNQTFNPMPNYSDLINKGNVIKARCINCQAKKYIIDSYYTSDESQSWLEKIDDTIRLLRQVKKDSSV